MQSHSLLPSFQRCRFIEIRLAMASMPIDREAWNTLNSNSNSSLHVFKDFEWVQ